MVTSWPFLTHPVHVQHSPHKTKPRKSTILQIQKIRPGLASRTRPARALTGFNLNVLRHAEMCWAPSAELPVCVLAEQHTLRNIACGMREKIQGKWPCTHLLVMRGSTTMEMYEMSGLASSIFCWLRALGLRNIYSQLLPLKSNHAQMHPDWWYIPCQGLVSRRHDQHEERHHLCLGRENAENFRDTKALICGLTYQSLLKHVQCRPVTPFHFTDSHRFPYQPAAQCRSCQARP